MIGRFTADRLNHMTFKFLKGFRSSQAGGDDDDITTKLKLTSDDGVLSVGGLNG